MAAEDAACKYLHIASIYCRLACHGRARAQSRQMCRAGAALQRRTAEQMQLNPAWKGSWQASWVLRLPSSFRRANTVYSPTQNSQGAATACAHLLLLNIYEPITKIKFITLALSQVWKGSNIYADQELYPLARSLSPTSLPPQAEDGAFSVLCPLPGQYPDVCFNNLSGLLTKFPSDTPCAFALPGGSQWVRRQLGHKQRRTLRRAQQRCQHLLLGPGPWSRGAAAGSRDELLPNESFLPIPPFWQSQHHLPLPTKGIGSTRLGKGRDPSFPSSSFPAVPVSKTSRVTRGPEQCQLCHRCHLPTDINRSLPRPWHPEQTHLLLAGPVGSKLSLSATGHVAEQHKDHPPLSCLRKDY